MKTSNLFSLVIAFAVVVASTTAYGQYAQQQYPQQTPQQSWQQGRSGGIIQPAQNAPVYQSSFAKSNTPVGTPVPQSVMDQGCGGCGSASTSGCCGDTGSNWGEYCQSGCGDGCCAQGACCSGRGGGCLGGGRRAGGCGGGACCGGGRGCGGCGGGCGGCGLGAYNPCCPQTYFSFFGGGVEYEPVTFNLGLFDPQQQGAVISAPLDFNDGFAVGGAVGRTIGRRFRGEVEFAYRNARLQSAALNINGQPQGAIQLAGTLNQYSCMPNFMVDLNPGGRLNIYGGLGAGVVFNDLDAREPTTPIGIRLRASSFAYQGIAGVSTRLRNGRMEPFAEYRYFGTDKLRIDAAAPIGTANADVDITSNNVMFGVRVFR